MIDFLFHHWGTIAGAFATLGTVAYRYGPLLLSWRRERAISKQQEIMGEAQARITAAQAHQLETKEYTDREKDMLKRLDTKDASLEKILTNHIAHLEAKLTQDEQATRALLAFFEKQEEYHGEIRRELIEVKQLASEIKDDTVKIEDRTRKL